MHDLLRHNRVLSGLLEELKELYDEEDFGTHSVEVECLDLIGWSSTDSRWKYRDEHLEEFSPNRHSKALRVKRESRDLAPATTFITLVFEFKLEGTKPVAVIHSVYPGKDIGELDGDITEREEVVFFDFRHLGIALNERDEEWNLSEIYEDGFKDREKEGGKIFEDYEAWGYDYDYDPL